MKTKFQIISIIALLIVFLYVGMVFVEKGNTPNGHFYQIQVNNQTYNTTAITVDSLHNRISFKNLLGGTITAPLDRTVINQY